MGEREITGEEIRVGDEIRLEFCIDDVKCTNQGIVAHISPTSLGYDVIYLGTCISGIKLTSCKVILVNRSPRESPISAKEVRPGMLINVGGAHALVTSVNTLTNINFKLTDELDSLRVSPDFEVMQVVEE